MSQKNSLTSAILALASATAFLVVANTASAGTNYKVLHNFTESEGAPSTGLVADAVGNLYGVTSYGGSEHVGTVFELSPVSGGKWKRTVLYNFKGRKDGATPYGNLVFDAMGDLYGTTHSGGQGPCDCGTVYELTPMAGGGWQHVVLYRFQGGTDGAYPWAGVILDSGNIYGTTVNGNTGRNGTVFELSPASGGGWTETVIYSFTGRTDGRNPYAGLVSDSAGNLYGTTRFGGTFPYDNGVAFELQPSGSEWTEVVIHDFGDNAGDGINPMNKLIFDGSGNLYGTTLSGGTGSGTVFELTPATGGSWTEALLFSFGGKDGGNPDSGLVFDGTGNLYGQTYSGGCSGGQVGCSLVYQLTPQAGGKWKEMVLHRFATTAVPDGTSSGLIVDAAGDLYGTFAPENVYGGVVFEIEK